MYIRSMHNRSGAASTPREISLRDGIVLVPLILAIVALALYPQLRSTPSSPASRRERPMLSRAAREQRRCAAILFAQAKTAGPTIDWAALAPLLALITAPVSC